MLSLILVVCIGLIVAACLLTRNYKTEGFGVACGVTGGVVGVVVLIVLAVVIALNSELAAIPSKIDILEEQNKQIEYQIDTITENYLDHEGKTYEKLTPDNAQLFAVAYPQLSSNETVKKQMDLYICNNKQITELKLEMCNGSVYRWWLYFGK